MRRMKTIHRLVASVALLATCLSYLSGCAGVLMPASPAAKSAPASSSVNVEDAKLAGAVRQRLNADDRVGRFGITVRSSQGRVTLSGTVASYALRDHAVQLARQTTGTSSVDSRLIVNSSL